jgi:hypothetical protein
MTGHLGSTFPPEGVAWWTTFMSCTAVSTQIGFRRTIACADIRADVPKIACPTLVITTEGSGLAAVDDTRAWQQTIPDSELLVLPGDSYRGAASHAVQCAQATLAFIERGIQTRGDERRGCADGHALSAAPAATQLLLWKGDRAWQYKSPRLNKSRQRRPRSDCR